MIVPEAPTRGPEESGCCARHRLVDGLAPGREPPLPPTLSSG